MTGEVELLEALDDLAQHVAWPAPTIDVTGRAVDVLPSDRVPVVRRRPRWLVASGGIAAAIAVTVAVVPPARHAMADLLGLGGVRITLQRGVPPDLDAALDLGQPVSLDGARQVAPAPLPIPAGIEEPAAAFAGRPPGGVTLVWAPADDLPAVLDHGVGLLVTVFRGELGQDGIGKQLFGDGTIELTAVDGSAAYWLAGSPHTFMYLDERGEEQEDTIRLSGNALVWVRDGITYRLESALSQADAVRLAETIPRS